MDTMDLIQKHFKTRDLYAVIKISAGDAADPKKLRSAYLKSALVFHPDKVELMERESCTEKFQLIAKIFEMLKDDDLRKVYDDSGDWPDDEKFNLDEASLSRLNLNLLDEFKAEYQGSEEERSDVKNWYVKCKGNILDLIENIYFAGIETDEERIEGIVKDLLKKKEVTEFPQPAKMVAERKLRIKRAQKEAREAEAMLEEMGLNQIGNGEAGLHQAILARREKAGKSFLDSLEKKYSGQEKEPQSKRSRRTK